LVPGETCRHHGAGKHGLAVGNAREARRIEGAEGVKGVALHPGTLHRRLEKRQIEGWVVANQNGSRAPVLGHGIPHMGENFIQCISLAHRQPERMPGIDSVGTQCRLFEPRPLKRFHMTGHRTPPMPSLRVVVRDQHCGDFKQRVSFGIEATRFHVHDHRQESAKALREDGLGQGESSGAR